MTEKKSPSETSIWPYLLISAAIGEGIIPGVMAIFVLPKVFQFYDSLSTSFNPFLPFITLFLIFSIIVIQLVLGVILLRNPASKLVNKAPFVFVLGVIVVFLSLPFLISSIINPIYSLTNSILK